MSVSTTIQLRGKGTLTLPVELRRKYGLQEGDALTLIDLGEGSFLLTPQLTQLDRLGDRVAQALADEGLTLEDILLTLREERERYYHERYVED